MKTVTLERTLLIALCALLVCAVSLQADWLVTQDGQRIETRGPWKVKGKMVVFTLPNGTFSSLRADQVDLEASRDAEKVIAEEARKAEEEEAKANEPAEPVLELTDADLPRRYRSLDDDEDELAQDDAADEDDPTTEAAPPSGPAITVSGWQKLDDGDGGFEIVGTFRNGSAKMASDIQVTVMLFDEEGVIVDAVGANLTSASLGPDEQGQFSAVFDTPGEFESLKFDVSSFDIEGDES